MHTPKETGKQPAPTAHLRKELEAVLRLMQRHEWLSGGLLAGLLLFLVLVNGLALGYLSGLQERRSLAQQQGAQSAGEQYDLGVKDMAEGNYDVARQRFEYVLSQDPGYPGAVDRLAEALNVLAITATPTPLPATATPTPPPDARSSQELLDQARGKTAASEWDAALDLLAQLRKQDRSFQPERVDGLMFLALRSRGLQKIEQSGNLEGGIYDLAVAERFGPLDGRARDARDLARLYVMGLSFWEVDPRQAMEYFSQLAAASPGLRDASGWTAAERYQAAMIQYADQLASGGQWCDAQAQYEQALAAKADEALAATATYAAEQCSPPTATPDLSTLTATATLQATLTLEPGATLTLTNTPTVPVFSTPTSTPTPALPDTPTLPVPTLPEQPSPTQPAPTDTPPATAEPTLGPPPLLTELPPPPTPGSIQGNPTNLTGQP